MWPWTARIFAVLSDVAAGKNIKWFRYFLVLGIIMHGRNWWYHPSDSLLLLLLFGVHPHIPFSFCGEFQLMSVCAAKTFRRYGVICLCSILSAPSIASLMHHTAAAAPHRLYRCRANKTPPQLPTPKTRLPGMLALPAKFYVTLNMLRFQGWFTKSADS